MSAYSYGMGLSAFLKLIRVYTYLPAYQNLCLKQTYLYPVGMQP